MFTRNRIKTVLTLTALALLAGSADAETILTGLGAKNQPVPVDHGSNEVNTPNIALNWAGNWDQYPSWDGRGDVYQIDNSTVANPHTITFTPDAGYDVNILSFDLDEWAGGGDTIVEWSVVGSSSGTLGSGTWDDFSDANGGNGGRSTLSPNLTGAAGEVLTLSFGQVSGDRTYLAMDNLTFDQEVVPEPATMTLLGLGGLMLLMYRRRWA